MCALSRVRLCDPPGSSVCGILQARRLEWVSRQEDWSGLPFPSPGDLPNPGIEPWSPALEADALTSEPHQGSPVSVLPPSKGNQLCVYRYSLFFEFPSHIGHHRRLSRVPHAAPVVTHYLSLLDAVSGMYICQSQSLRSSHVAASPLGVHTFLFSKSVSLLLLCHISSPVPFF